MNRIKSFLQSIILLLLLCLPLKGVAQGVEMLSDSLVYNVTMYQDLYKKYRNKKGQLQQDVISIIKEQRPDVESKVNLNAKFDALGLDSVDVAALAKTVSDSVKASISEDDVASLSTVYDLFEAVRSEGDTIMLIMAYYPWREVLESRSVHRVGVYEDGIAILGDLIALTKDSIQREIYLNELMNVYDVWYENVDTINTRMNSHYSKTLILSEKARKYVDECMPLVYGMYHDSINKSNIMAPYAVREYNLLRDALYEQEHKEDLHYTIPTYYFNLSQSAMAYHAGNRNIKAFEKQYHADFDSVDGCFKRILAMELETNVRVNYIEINHGAIKKKYDETCFQLDLDGAGDWRELDSIYRDQLAKKRELWDDCVEEPDVDFLDDIIRKIKNDSSDVRLEALECYVQYIVPTPAKGENISADKVEEYIAKRRLLFQAYGSSLRGRYKDCIAIADEILKVEKNAVDKAFWYYQTGKMYIVLSNQSISAKEKDVNMQYAALRFKRAVSSNPNYAAALYRLASAYSSIRYSLDGQEDRLKVYLCNKYATKALENLQKNATDSDFARYHDKAIKEEDIKRLLSWCKDNMGEDLKFLLFQMGYTSGSKFTFGNKGVWKNESIIVP